MVKNQKPKKYYSVKTHEEREVGSFLDRSQPPEKELDEKFTGNEGLIPTDRVIDPEGRINVDPSAEDIQQALQAPFAKEDLEWRVAELIPPRYEDGPKARVLCYVTARAIQNRLDDVLGVANWSDSYDHLDGGVLCTLKVRESALGLNFPGSEERWVSKTDGSPETKIEAFKGGVSKALVRCGVKFGIGRYLYELGNTKVVLMSKDFIKENKISPDNWVRLPDSRDKRASFWPKELHGKYVSWNNPVLPKEFLP